MPFFAPRQSNRGRGALTPRDGERDELVAETAAPAAAADYNMQLTQPWTSVPSRAT